MTSERGAPRGSSPWIVDAAIIGLSAALVGVTALIVVVPEVAPAAVSDRLDSAIGAGTVLTAAAVAALQWARGRVTADATALLRGSAFAVLAVLNASTLAVLLLQIEGPVGASLDDPGQVPLYVTLVGRAVVAVLLVVAGLPQLRGRALGLPPMLVLTAPAVLVLLTSVGLVLVGDGLPALAGPEALSGLEADPTAFITAGAAPLLVIVQAMIGGVFLLAAALAYRSFHATRRLSETLLAAGLVVAAFSQVHSAIHPGAYIGLVTSADLLRLLFAALLLLGILVDHLDDLRAVRQANVDLRRLADAELATAALQERARLAREIHDGLAQDLWFAKLKHTRLAQLAGFGGEALGLSQDVEGAIDSALAEARHAVAAMREGADVGSLTDALARHVDDFGDRFALRAELRIEGPVPTVGPRQQVEILRIVQEALTNARRHADATLVRVEVHANDDLRIAIIDNGRGFRTDNVTPGFGLESMRQRADLIGAQLSVSSAPQDGTRVQLLVPQPAGSRGEEGADDG